MTGGMFTLLRGAHLYAPDDLGTGDLLLCGGKVALMAPHLDVNLPELNVYDLHGKRLLPGLCDQHVHLTGGGGERGFESRIREVSLTDCTRVGVTTVVGVLGTDSVSRTPENLLARAKALTADGITAYCLTGAYAFPSPTITGSVKKDVALIAEVLGVKLAISDHRCTLPTAQELARLAAEVRQAALLAGKAGVVHLHTGVGKQGLSMLEQILDETDLPIRHFRPTHMENCFAHAMRFAQRGGYIDFTADADLEPVAKTLLRALEHAPAKRITLSSDAGGSIPIWNERNELTGVGVGTMAPLYGVIRTLIIAHGVAPETALSLITRNVAEALSLSGKGVIAQGADADFVITDDDWTIDSVIAKGRFMVREKQVVHHGFLTYPA